MRVVGLIAGAGAAGLVACATLADLQESAPPSLQPSSAGPLEPDAPAASVEDGVEITPESIEFGPVTCGGEATEQLITIRNLRDETLDWAASLPDGSALRIKGAVAGQVGPKGVVTIPVTISPTAAGTQAGGVIVTAGKSYRQVLTRAEGIGAVLEVVPGAIDFGEARAQTSAAPFPVDLKNTGTGPALITGFDGETPAFDVTWAPSGSFQIPPGASHTVNVQFHAPSETGPATPAKLSPIITSAACAPAPILEAKGTTINTTVALSVADFGVVACNTTPANREVTVSNHSSRTLQITNATLPTPSRFTVQTKFPVELPPASGGAPGIARVAIGAVPTGMNLSPADEELTVVIAGIDPPDGGQKTTRARIDVQGAILRLEPALQVFRSNGFFMDSKSYTLTNDGNASVVVAHSLVLMWGGPAWIWVRDSRQVPPGATIQVGVGFQPGGPGMHEARLTPRRVNGAAVCTQVPFATARGNP